MTRISPAEVRGLFTRVLRAAGAAGVDVHDWWLDGPIRGLSRQGPWGVSAGKSVMPLGRTDRDAALTLSGMERAFLLVPVREEVREPACPICEHADADHGPDRCYRMPCGCRVITGKTLVP